MELVKEKHSMAYADPWADEPDEAQNDTTSFDVDTTPATNSKEQPVADTDQNYATLILKGGKSYGAPSISLRGSDIGDLLRQVETFDKELKTLVERSAKIAKVYASLMGDDAKPAGGGNRQGGGGDRGRNNGRPQGAVEAPEWAGEPPVCDGCGEEKVYKTSISEKNNRPWHAWDCPGTCRDSREFINAPRRDGGGGGRGYNNGGGRGDYRGNGGGYRN
jgi:hypothetical protein